LLWIKEKIRRNKEKNKGWKEVQREDVEKSAKKTTRGK